MEREAVGREMKGEKKREKKCAVLFNKEGVEETMTQKL